MLICGIAMALRATELRRLNVGDVLDDNGDVRRYVTIRGETAKFGKKRTLGIGRGVQQAIAAFIDHKGEVGESGIAGERCTDVLFSEGRASRPHPLVPNC